MNGSGTDGRNKSCQEWLILIEYPCIISREVVWAKVVGYPWWPSLLQQRSGIELIRDKLIRKEIHSKTKTNNDIEINLNSANSGTLLALNNINKNSKENDTRSRRRNIINRHNDEWWKNSQKPLSLYLFGDESSVIIPVDNISSSIISFEKRSKEIQSGFGKVKN